MRYIVPRYFAGLLTAFLFMGAALTPAHAWLIYHKPEFKGRLIDIDTKEPIEGAVVVAAYYKKIFRFMPESGSVIMDVREALTSKEGTFSIPSYTTVTDPLSWNDPVIFVIYKPGYLSIQMDLEDYFSGKGTTDQEGEWMLNKAWKFNLRANGTIELSKLKTKEERLRAVPGGPGDTSSKDLPLLYKAINEEYRSFGLGEVGTVGNK